MLGGSSHGHPAGVVKVETFNVDSEEWSPSFTLPSGYYINVFCRLYVYIYVKTLQFVIKAQEIIENFVTIEF